MGVYVKGEPGIAGEVCARGVNFIWIGLPKGNFACLSHH